MAAKPTVAELLSRIEVLEQRINVLEASASRPSTNSAAEKRQFAQAAAQRRADMASEHERRVAAAQRLATKFPAKTSFSLDEIRAEMAS